MEILAEAASEFSPSPLPPPNKTARGRNSKRNVNLISSVEKADSQ
jgi:hypothetical protein